MDKTQEKREEAARRPRQQSPGNGQKRAQSGTRRPTAEEPSRQPRKEPAAPAGTQWRAGAEGNAGASKPAPRQQPKQSPSGTGEARRRPAASGQKQPDRKQRPAAQKTQTPKSSRQEGLPDSVSNKKRAYGNSKPKKKSALASVGALFRGAAQKRAADAQEKKRSSKKTSRPKQRPQQPAPAVIYTQPQAFNRNRLFVQLLTVTAVVVALVMGLSVFFKVETITVSGADVYSAWTVREASGINEGDNLLTFSRARAGALIKANLPYVKDVRFGIKLPDTVNIIIVEEEVVYAIKDSNGQWWLMNSDGRVVEQTNSGKASNYTQVLGVTLEYPVAGEKGIATESAPAGTDASGEVVPVTITGAQRLTTALQILKALEENDIVGSAASVDVSRIEDIVLWYGTRYQVNLGDSSRLDYKIACMNDVILQMSDYQSGILDLSFTIWPDKVGYTPFA